MKRVKRKLMIYPKASVVLWATGGVHTIAGYFDLSLSFLISGKKHTNFHASVHLVQEIYK